MSSDSLKKSGVSSQSRSISDIVEGLRNSFQPSDFKAAENELMAREEGLRLEKMDLVASLREKSDFFEGERNELKLEKIQLEEERRRLLRELDVKDDQLKDVTRKLSSAKEDEEKATKRYTGLFKELKDMMVEKGELLQNLADMTSMVDTLKRNLREKDGVIDDLTREKESRRDSWLGELVEARKKIESLEEEKVKLDERVEALKREKEESIKVVKMNEVEKREAEEIRRKNVVLMEQKAKSDEIVKNLRRCEEQKDERIKKLSKDIELLEREKSETVKEKDSKIQGLVEEKGILDLERRKLKTKNEEVEKRFSKLEQDVITCLCLNLEKDKNFAGSQFGKILSKIIMALDSEDFDLSNAGGNIQEADSALKSHANESERGMTSDKQPVEDVRRTLVFDCDDATANKRTVSTDPIIIDSDDDGNENTQRCSIGVKRQYSGSLSKHQNYDCSSDDSLNPKLKTKKLKHLQSKQVKQELSSAIKSDHKLNSPQRQTLASMIIGEEKLSREVTGPRSCSFSKDDRRADGSKSDCGTLKADEIKKKIEQLTNSFRQRKQNKRLECEADMVYALDQDFDLCAKAVCALYRLKKKGISPMKGLTCLRSGPVLECDFERMNDLAKYLTDGNPRGKMKKSVDELQKYDPRGPDDCRRLAKGYSKQLIDIYRKGQDLLFSPSSTDLKYI